MTLYEAVQEFWVVEDAGTVVGCGAMHVLWSDLGEVRTVAVDPSVKGRGAGHLVVAKLIEVARDLELERLFVLTFEVDFRQARLRGDRGHAGHRGGVRRDVPVLRHRLWRSSWT